MSFIDSARAGLAKVARYAVPLLVLCGGIGGYLSLTAARKKPAQQENIATRTPVVEVQSIARHESGIAIEVGGLVVPYREIELAPEVMGRVAHKSELCRAGRYVSAGTQLIQIDRRDYDLALDEAQASLDEIRAEITNVKSLTQIAQQQLELEKRDYSRELQLGRAVSQKDLDQAKRELLNAERSLLDLRNQQALLRSREGRMAAAVRRAELDLERTTIRAPVSGVIVRDLVEQDDFVQRGTPVVSMEDTSQVEVQCNLRKENLRWLWLSQADSSASEQDPNPAAAYEVPEADAEVLFDLAGHQYRWRATLARYDGIGVDSTTRTVPCRIVVHRPLGAEHVDGDDRLGRAPALVRGMYVRVRIQAQPRVPLWRVPARAIQPGNVIWVPRDRADGDAALSGQSVRNVVSGTTSSSGKTPQRLVRYDVRIAQADQNHAVVQLQEGALRAGDMVVVSPLSGDGPSDIRSADLEGLRIETRKVADEVRDPMGD